MSKKRIFEATGYTVDELIANTRRVLGSSLHKSDGENYSFQNIKKNDFSKFKYVSYDTQTFNPESSRHYNTSIFFYNVDVANGEHPDPHKSPVRVSCNCPAYYFYFSYWNKVHGAHARRPLRPYVRKTPPPPEGLPERNPMHVPGMCKHLMAFADYLSDGEYMFGDTPITKAYTPFSTAGKDKAFGTDPKPEVSGNEDQ